jgi:signal transduction histidine kinase/CheY-like chemotaxis protein/CHASE3 domain sensor protein
MNNANFKRNLVIGFSASLVILLITAAASYYSIQGLLRSADLVGQTNSVIHELNEIQSAMVDGETGQRGYLLTGVDDFLEPYKNSQDRALEAFENVRTLTSDNEFQQNTLSEVRTVMEDRFQMLGVSIEARRNNEPIKPENLVRGKELMEELRRLLQTVETREFDLLNQRTEAMNTFATYTPPLIITGAVIALLLTLSFFFKVKSDFDERLKLQLQLEEKDQEISRRIDIIRGIANRIAAGDYATRVDDTQSDALGSVGYSLNSMADSLQQSFTKLSDREWTQSGIAKLNEVLMVEKPLPSLCTETLQFVASYINSGAGAMYLLEKNELKFAAGFAFKPSSSREKIGLHEGILGEAVAQSRPIQLSDIKESNITISYTSGQVRPTQVIAFPLVDGRQVKGGIELATIHPFDERTVDFLKASASIIAIAVSTAQNKRRVQELLDETQSQAEELKVQHGELENLNGELEAQTEKLQASEEELRVQQEELRQANQELEERSRLLEERNQLISERNAEIQAKADQLAQSTKYKSEFLANMSHELRTPLNSILLLSRLLSENQTNNLSIDQVEYAKVIQTSGNGLLSLIDEILDLSKIEAGKMKLEFQKVALKSVVDQMVGLFQPLANDKGIEFRTTISSEVPEMIETDKLRLEQIIRNLISNAIKFTSNGFVALSIDAGPTPRSIKIRVKDTGIGIPDDKKEIIFDAFQQADGSTRRKFGGTGLGLSISRELARLLGGTISVISKVNEGSEFTVTIPKSKDDIQEPNSREDKKATFEHDTPPVEVVPQRTHQYISKNVPQSIPDDRETITQGDKTLLIIEDDISFAKSLQQFARTKGYKAVVAVRGDEGIDLARSLNPVGILLDIQLPVKSGWEVMDELKEDPKTRHIPVHIMSSHQVKNESLMKGAVDFIDKPFAFDQMSEMLKKIEHVLTHHPKKVLIVEENAKHAKALASFLETFDLSLEINNDVREAVTSLKDKNIDCVILDMGVPDQKAYETLEVVKKTPGLENLPIIVFTGKSISPNEELKIKQYADSIVVKTAQSYKRILDEVSVFLHLMEKNKGEPTTRRFGLGNLDEVLKNKKVLVVDDDMRNIFSLTKALEKFEMTVIPAVDGKDALQKIKENPGVDVVLMDMMMPEMDGYESTTEIRKIPRFRNLPIIAVTAKAMTGDRAKCIDAGASDYITKPIDIDQLFSLLRVWLYEKA